MANPVTQTAQHGSTTIARLAGSLTVMVAPDLRVALMDLIESQKPKVLALNLKDVDFVDSSALGVFVEARRQMIAGDGTVAFTNVNHEVRGLMRIMKLDAVFDFADDENDLVQ